MEFSFSFLGLHFLAGDNGAIAPYAAEHSMQLVALSYVFAFAGSFAGLTVSRQLMDAKSRLEWTVWLILGSAALGGAVWSMHFIAMLSYRLPFAVSYDLLLTCLSVVPSFGAYQVYGRIQESLGAARTSLLMYLIPLYNSVLAFLLLGERFQTYHLAGAALVLPGIYLATRRR